MADSTFSTPDLTTFARLDPLGLQVTGQFLEPDRVVLACRIVDRDDRCGRCGEQGRPRDSTTRRLVQEPFGWRPTVLLVTIRRYRCESCGHVWRQDTSKAAEPRARLSRGGLRWALTAEANAARDATAAAATPGAHVLVCCDVVLLGPGAGVE